MFTIFMFVIVLFSLRQGCQLLPNQPYEVLVEVQGELQSSSYAQCHAMENGEKETLQLGNTPHTSHCHGIGNKQDVQMLQPAVVPLPVASESNPAMTSVASHLFKPVMGAGAHSASLYGATAMFHQMYPSGTHNVPTSVGSGTYMAMSPMSGLASPHGTPMNPIMAAGFPHNHPQMFSFGPAYLSANPLLGQQGAPVSTSPVSHIYLNPAAFPSMPMSPGFLTAAGYQSSLLGGVKTSTPMALTSQETSPLHKAAILGDKQKMAEILQEDQTNLESRDRWGRVALVYSILGNHQECVEQLLKAGARIDAFDSYRRTPLHFAAYRGHVGCVKALLHVAVERKGSEGVWLAKDARGITPLHHAAHHRNHKCLALLLKHAAPGTLDIQDHRKKSPLHWAAAYGCDENVRLLIKHGANNLTPDNEGKTPLHWAAMSKADTAKFCVKTLVEAAPSSVNWQDFDGITALHLAVAEAQEEVIDVLLSVPRCDVTMFDNQYRTALHWACNRGLTKIVSKLLERGAQLGAVDIFRATPLHYAAQLDHKDTVEQLVRRAYICDDPSFEGHTPLHWAAAKGADQAITVMVRHGASLHHIDARGCSALHIAAGSGHLSTVNILLTLKSIPDAVGKDGRTPLLHAVQAGHTAIVKLLTKHGASLDHRDNEGQCALHHAVLNGHLYLSQQLIKAGLHINVQDYYGRTPLHMAAYTGHVDIIFLLLENRGDVNARDHEGKSPLHWAARKGHLGAVNRLLEFHAYPNYIESTQDRYTPLDCAHIADELEIAQVISEAGGVSVTRIMEVAATRIQAFWRGYSVRRQSMFKGKQPVKTENRKCSNIGTLIKEKGETSKKGKGESPQMNLSEDPMMAYEGDKNKTKKEEVPLSPQVERSKIDKNKHKFTGGHGRIKGLASSFVRGGRKKTERHLELPDFGELGIGDVGSIEKQPENAGQHPEENHDNLEKPKPAANESLLPLTEASHMRKQKTTTTTTTPGSELLNSTRKEEVEDKNKPKLSCGETEQPKKEQIGTEVPLSNIQMLDDQSFHQLESAPLSPELRRKLIQERAAKALELAQKEGMSTHARPIIVSAEVRKRAEIQWQSKLSKLTLKEVGRQGASQAIKMYSYNMASQTSTGGSQE